MRQFDPWPVFFRREWKRNWPFLVGFAITGFIITKFSLSLIEEDVKNSPLAQKHNSEEEELLLGQGPIDMKVLCDVCKREEAAVYCCADEAALCVDCDIRIHRANKLAGKHRRFSLLHPSSPQRFPLCNICQNLNLSSSPDSSEFLPPDTISKSIIHVGVPGVEDHPGGVVGVLGVQVLDRHGQAGVAHPPHQRILVQSTSTSVPRAAAVPARWGVEQEQKHRRAKRKRRWVCSRLPMGGRPYVQGRWARALSGDRYGWAEESKRCWDGEELERPSPLRVCRRELERRDKQEDGREDGEEFEGRRRRRPSLAVGLRRDRRRSVICSIAGAGFRSISDLLQAAN